MIEEYKKASGDVWKYFKNHFETSDDDEYWDEVVKCASKIAKKHEGTPLEAYVREYIVVCVNELSRIHKGGGK